MKIEDWPADKIKQLRRRLHLNQVKAAAMIGVTSAAWCSWESGRYGPTKPMRLLLSLLDEGVLTERIKRLQSVEAT